MSGGPPVFTPRRKILSPEEMNTVAQAASYLGEARRIHSKIQADADAALARAKDEGYKAGYADGRRAALADLAGGVAQARERVATSESELVAIVMVAIERMLGQLDQTDLARRCLRRALADAADEIWAIIRVSPEELAMFAEDLTHVPQTERWPEIKAVEAEPLLKPGEIMIETPKGRIHVGLRQQLSRLQSGLEQLDA